MADPDLQIRVGGGGRGGGGGVVGIPDPEKKGGGPGLPKKFFSPFGPHFARKIRGGRAGRPGSATERVLTYNSLY